VKVEYTDLGKGARKYKTEKFSLYFSSIAGCWLLANDTAACCEDAVAIERKDFEHVATLLNHVIAEVPR
jgi:hypothetical protein